MSEEIIGKKETIQLINILEKNPELLRRGRDLVTWVESSDMGLKWRLQPPELCQNEDEQLENQTKEVDALVERIKMQALEQMRSEVSRLLNATRKQSSTRFLMQAMSDSIEFISNNTEVKEIYSFVESEELRLTIIHNSENRIGILRQMMKIENMLDLKYPDIFFEFKVLHGSEMNETLKSQGLTIFKRS